MIKELLDTRIRYVFVFLPDQLYYNVAMNFWLSLSSTEELCRRVSKQV